jgi:hypothetical protein
MLPLSLAPSVSTSRLVEACEKGQLTEALSLCLEKERQEKQEQNAKDEKGDLKDGANNVPLHTARETLFNSLLDRFCKLATIPPLSNRDLSFALAALLSVGHFKDHHVIVLALSRVSEQVTITLDGYLACDQQHAVESLMECGDFLRTCVCPFVFFTKNIAEITKTHTHVQHLVASWMREWADAYLKIAENALSVSQSLARQQVCLSVFHTDQTLSELGFSFQSVLLPLVDYWVAYDARIVLSNVRDIAHFLLNQLDLTQEMEELERLQQIECTECAMFISKSTWLSFIYNDAVRWLNVHAEISARFAVKTAGDVFVSFLHDMSVTLSQSAFSSGSALAFVFEKIILDDLLTKLKRISEERGRERMCITSDMTLDTAS